MKKERRNLGGDANEVAIFKQQSLWKWERRGARGGEVRSKEKRYHCIVE
jgi:hypothetical protein